MRASLRIAAFDRVAPPLLARTILVVEDEDLVRDTITGALDDAGYLVIEAVTAEEGLAVLRQRPVGVLFTDIRLPGRMDGWRLAQEARSLNPTLCVIYATGFSAVEPQIVPNGILLRKPYLPSAVIATIERLTGVPS